VNPVNLQFLDSMMQSQYNDERIQTQLFSAFSLLAIIIACLGLYGLAAVTGLAVFQTSLNSKLSGLANSGSSHVKLARELLLPHRLIVANPDMFFSRLFIAVNGVGNCGRQCGKCCSC
jgi:hypothetical protein